MSADRSRDLGRRRAPTIAERVLAVGHIWGRGLIRLVLPVGTRHDARRVFRRCTTSDNQWTLRPRLRLRTVSVLADTTIDSGLAATSLQCFVRRGAGTAF